ncbi:MAG TPA: rhomboid family intramembrane serine protease [Bacteroidales bacterium]|nr:rhomboid family intramembrane serine protease [Bacteroidales bacterium]
MSILNDISSQFRKGTNLLKLIYINAALFLIVVILEVISVLVNAPQLTETVVGYLAVPASLPELATKPWTIITYMFLHEDFWHILFNMLWLYWLGRIFTDYFDQKKLVAVYLLGGLSGALLYILSFNIFPAFSDVLNISVALGASAGVMAVVIATAVYVPDFTLNFFLLGRIKLKYVALGIFLLTSVFDFSTNTGGRIAHIGGALLGYIYSTRYKQGKDIGKWINRIIDAIATWFKPRKKMKVTYKRTMTDFEYNSARASHQEQINKILEKISKAGYDSLTKEEKELLFKESQKKN